MRIMLLIMSIVPTIIFSMNEESYLLTIEQNDNHKKYNYKKTLSGHSDSVNGAFFESNEILYTASEDKTVKKYDFSTNQVKTYEQLYQAKIIDGNKNGTHLAIGHDSGIVTIFNKENEKQEKIYNGMCSPIFALTFHSTNDLVAFGECEVKGQGIKLWNIEHERPSTLLNSSFTYLTSLSFNTVRPNIMASASCQSCNIWDIEREIRLLWNFWPEILPWVVYNRASNVFAVSTESTKNITLGNDLEKKNTIITLKGSGKHSLLQWMEFNGNTTLLLGFSDGVEILDLRNETIIEKFPTVRYPTYSWCGKKKSKDMDDDTHEGSIRALAISKDTTQFATCSSDKTVKIWNSH